MDVRNIANVFIANADMVDVGTGTTTYQIWEKGLATYPTAGSVVATDQAGRVKTQTATTSSASHVGKNQADYLQLVQVKADGITYSAPIKGAQVKSYNVKSYSAAKEEIWAIGTSASGGVLTTTGITTLLEADKEYALRIIRQDDPFCDAKQEMKRASFKYESTPTELQIATDLTNVMRLAFGGSTTRYSNREDLKVRIDLVADTAITATDLPNDVLVVEGSKYATTTGAVTANLTAGTYVSLGRTTTVNGVSTVIPSIYKLAVDATATQLVFTEAYEGPSATIAAANAGSIALTSSSKFGFFIEGVAQEFVPGLYPYEKTRFIVEVFGNMNVAPVKVQSADKGVGTYEEAAENEWLALGFTGSAAQINRDLIGNVRTYLATSGRCYDVLSINWTNETTKDFTGTVTQEGVVTVYIDNTATAASAAENLVDTIDRYVVTTWGVGAVQVGNLT